MGMSCGWMLKGLDRELAAVTRYGLASIDRKNGFPRLCGWVMLRHAGPSSFLVICSEDQLAYE
jgi:hypothetical protein